MAILFSYLYLKNYRKMSVREISFDHCYRYDPEKKQILKDENCENVFGSYFYGKNIYSATCLVGKNGEGKTSLIDFLRDSFVLLKHDLDSGRLSFSGEGLGIPEMTKEIMSLYHLDEGTQFLVIFKNGRDYCYVTNIEEVHVKKNLKTTIKAYVPSENNGEASNYRIAYFSMMRFPEEVARQEKAYDRELDKNFRIYGEKAYDYENVLEQYNVDFSEELLQKRKGKNTDVLMQLAFLTSEKKSLIEEILGPDYLNRLEISNVDFSEARWKISAQALESGLDNQVARKLIDDDVIYLRPFSSGQYSRFAFLSRLHWYMGGGENYWNTSNMKKIREEAKRLNHLSAIEWLDRLKFGETSVVLLIDEGELYYHPEWQRRFVKDVFDIISDYEKAVDVQVVFTTSSTFMLSDILREDVVVLSKPNAEMKPYLEEDIQTFGQNIHMLLANRFFMDSTIGERAERLITGLFEMLTEKADETPDKWRERVKRTIAERFEAYVGAHPEIFKSDDIDDEFVHDRVDEFVHRLIASVGEDFYRRQLLGMFEEYKRKTRGLESQEAMVRRLLSEKMKTADAEQKASLKQAMELLGGKSGQ